MDESQAAVLLERESESGSDSVSGGGGEAEGLEAEGMDNAMYSDADAEDKGRQSAALNKFFQSRGRKARRSEVDYRVCARAAIPTGSVFDLELERRLDAALARFNKARAKKHRRMRVFREWERRQRARLAAANAAKAVAKAGKQITNVNANETPNAAS